MRPRSLLERAAQAIQQDVPALLLALVDQDHDGSDEQRLVRLHDALASGERPITIDWELFDTAFTRVGPAVAERP